MKSPFYPIPNSFNSHTGKPWIQAQVSRWEPPEDSSSLAHTQQEAHTNLQELETSPGSSTLQWSFAVNLARVFLSLITASSYMGKTRVTQTGNIHGRKNVTPAGCSHFELEIKSARTNWLYPHSVYSVVWKQQHTALFSSFSAFCNCAEVVALTMYILKLTHIALAHIFMTTVEKPQKKKVRTNCDCLLLKRKTICPPLFMPQAAEAVKRNQLWTLHMYSAF